MSDQTSRIPGFYKRSLDERAALVASWAGLTPQEQAVLTGTASLNAEAADHMIENALGTFPLPLGVATNFLVNGRDRLVPMVIEEPSVVAAVSNAARLFRAGGGFTTSSDEPVMIGQIQVLDVTDIEQAAEAVLAQKTRLLAVADEVGGSILRRGGGARDIQVRPLPETSVGPMLIVHLLFDARDAEIDYWRSRASGEDEPAARKVRDRTWRELDDDFAFVAAFIAIARSLWRGRRDLMPWLASGAVVAACLASGRIDPSWALVLGGVAGAAVAGVSGRE